MVLLFEKQCASRVPLDSFCSGSRPKLLKGKPSTSGKGKASTESCSETSRPELVPLPDGPEATWDPYGCCQTENKDVEEKNLKPVPASSEKGLCAMCLFESMQKGKEGAVAKALTATSKRYYETGYLELEKLTHETYAMGRSASKSFSFCYVGLLKLCAHSLQGFSHFSTVSIPSQNVFL